MNGHDAGPGHPEGAVRLGAVWAALDGPRFAALERRPVVAATRDHLRLVHDASHVAAVFAAVPESGLYFLDPDTCLSPGSGDAALAAAGALVGAVDGVMAGEGDNAFCAVRPPGHHAEPACSMGFCLFNNIAIAARHLRAAHGLARVAVVDFDVHHGNGTQAAFWNDPGVMYISAHQLPLYPGSGTKGETGIAGNIVNMPLPPGAGGVALRGAWRERAVPALRAFAPEFVLVSAGFDGHRDDPLAQLDLVDDDFSWISGEIVALAGEFCHGRVVSALEGGYNLETLASGAATHVAALMAASA